MVIGGTNGFGIVVGLVGAHSLGLSLVGLGDGEKGRSPHR
jgi:hypothetical protein